MVEQKYGKADIQVEFMRTTKLCYDWMPPMVIVLQSINQSKL